MKKLLSSLLLLGLLALPAAAQQITVPIGSAGVGTPASGTSGGILCFTSTSALASSALLGLNEVVVGGGAGACPTSKSGVTIGATFGFVQALGANTAGLTSTGYSLTGSNAQSLIDLAGTLNTSGAAVGLKIAWTITSGANAKFASFLGGAGGVTEVFNVDRIGTIAAASHMELTTAVSINVYTQYNTGTVSSFVGQSGGAGGLVTGSINGDAVYRTNARKHLFSVDAGTTASLALNTSAQLVAASTCLFGFSSTTDAAAAADVGLYRGGAAGVLSLARTGALTSAAVFNVYKTVDSPNAPVNYERYILGELPFSISGSSPRYGLASSNAGTGTSQSLDIGTQTSAFVNFFTNSVFRWQITSSGHLIAFADNTYDIGAVGATRPRTIYAGSGANLGAGSIVNAGSNLYIGTIGQWFLGGHADGVVELTGASLTGTGFGRLQFGGTTSSFPALKRSSAVLEVKLADDSAYGAFYADTLRTSGFAIGSLPTPGVAGRRAYVTDQITACAAVGTAPTAGGALVCPVFDNGTIWVGG